MTIYNTNELNRSCIMLQTNLSLKKCFFEDDLPRIRRATEITEEALNHIKNNSDTPNSNLVNRYTNDITNSIIKIRFEKWCSPDIIQPVNECLRSLYSGSEMSEYEEDINSCIQGHLSWPKEFSENINILKLLAEDQDEIFSAAKFCIDHNLKETFFQLVFHYSFFDPQKFGAQKTAELARDCAKTFPDLTIKMFDEFPIQDQQERYEITKILAENHPDYFYNNFETFKINDKNRVVELVKIAAKTKAHYSSSIIEDFGITANEYYDDLLDISQSFAEHSPDDAFVSLHEFSIKKEDRPPIIKMCAEKHPETTIFRMKLVAQQDHDFLFEIAKICAQKAPLKMAEFINSSKSDGMFLQEELVEIAKICAENDSERFINHIQGFNLLDERDRLEIAKICATHNTLLVAANFANFQITTQSAVDEFFYFCALQEPDSLYYRDLESSNVFALNLNTRLEPTKHQWNQNLAVEALNNYIQIHLSDCGFDWVIPFVEGIKDPQVQQNVTDSIAAALFLLRTRLTNDQLICANQHNLIRGIFETRAPHLQIPMVDVLCRFCMNENLNDFLNQEPMGCPFWKKMSRMLLSQMNYQTDYFNKPKFSKLFKDGPKAQLLLSVLLDLEKEPSLSSEEKIQVLNKITTSYDLYETLLSLRMIFDLEMAPLLKYSSQHIQGLAQRARKHKLPLPNIPGIEFKISNTFGESRNPQAIWQYAAKVHKTNDPQVMECLSTFVASVAEGTFDQTRYDLDLNPHLQIIGEEVVSRWREPVFLDTVEKGDWHFDHFKWLKEKLIIDKHIDLEATGMDFLFKYLSGESKAEQELNEALLKEDCSPKLLFQRACIDFAKSSPEKVTDCLQQININLNSLQQANSIDISEFINDLKSVGNKNTQECRGIDTDDPYDLLLSGTEVYGSCQRIDGNPNLNKALLGYIMNGQTRMLAIVDQKNRIIARSMLRLLWDGGQPVLFLERLYGDEQYRQAITKLAELKAKNMALSLTTIDSAEAMPYGKPIHSLGGIAPFEYCDASEGVAPQSKFAIQNPQVIFTPAEPLYVE